MDFHKRSLSSDTGTVGGAKSLGTERKRGRSPRWPRDLTFVDTFLSLFYGDAPSPNS